MSTTYTFQTLGEVRRKVPPARVGAFLEHLAREIQRRHPDADTLRRIAARCYYPKVRFVGPPLPCFSLDWADVITPGAGPAPDKAP